jgi:putative endopeptidase
MAMFEALIQDAAPAEVGAGTTREMFFSAARKAFARMLTILAIVCVTANTVLAQSRAANPAEAGVGQSTDPGDDFFAYANGAWLNATELPAGKQKWSARDELTELSRKRVLRLLDDASAAPAGSVERKVADFRAAWLNDAAIEANGIAPIKPALDRIDRVRDKAALTRLLGQGLCADVDPMNIGIFQSSHLLGLAVQASIHGEKNYVAFLVQGGLSLPERERYLSADPAMQALRGRYLEAVSRVLTLVGVTGDAPRRAEAVLALETAIAQSHATAEVSGVEKNADNLWTRADFANKAPGMDWVMFFSAAGMPRQASFVAWQPSAVQGAAALVASQPLEVWKDYLRLRAVTDSIDVLPRAFADQRPALRGEAPDGERQVARKQKADEAVQAAMGDAVARMYVQNYFPSEYKARLQTIAANVRAAFARRVAAVTWMSPASKATALAKLKVLYIGLAYPEKWQDYADLIVSREDPAGNLQRIAARNYRQNVARLGKPVDNSEWSIAPQVVGGILMFQQNSLDLTAALMVPPKFDPTASDAMNYGAIGAIIGHEMSHFIDTLGAEYEVDGRARRWWTPDDVARFQAANQPLVEQFAAYRPLPDLAPDLAIDGKLTLSENIADLGGLAAAFDAYRATLGSDAADHAHLLQHDREFFIGFAQSWRSKYSETGLRKQAANDHAPETYRIATVRNIDAWYDAFDVRPGSRLYLEPAARVRIW